MRDDIDKNELEKLREVREYLDQNYFYSIPYQDAYVRGYFAPLAMLIILVTMLLIPLDDIYSIILRVLAVVGSTHAVYRVIDHNMRRKSVSPIVQEKLSWLKETYKLEYEYRSGIHSYFYDPDSFRRLNLENGHMVKY